MKNRLLALMLIIILVLSLCFAGCERDNTGSSSVLIKEKTENTSDDSPSGSSEASTNNYSGAGSDFDTIDEDLAEYKEFENSDEKAIEDLIGSGIYFVSVEHDEGESMVVIPEYSGTPIIVINGNIPFFSENDLTTESFENYAPLDELGRCGTAFANICTDIMPLEERGPIGEIKPSGWQTVKYEGIDGNYLYNRCHLIAYSLAGENANECNLITGTRYLNIISMLPYELTVYEYAKNTGNHVLYRVTPVFQNDDLLAKGVLMEAESVEDYGQGIQFCVYCYNVQPGITIDYATGESEQVEVIYMPTLSSYKQESGDTRTETSSEEQTEDTSSNNHFDSEKPVVIPVVPSDTESDFEEDTTRATPENEIDSQEQVYVLNKNTKRFHYSWCDSVNEMKEKNKDSYTGDRQDLINMGYKPCGKCNP